MLQQKSPGFKPYVTTEIAMIPNHMLQQKIYDESPSDLV